jgi:tetratricopeptide (TPR) repeat protein
MTSCSGPVERPSQNQGLSDSDLRFKNIKSAFSDRKYEEVLVLEEAHSKTGQVTPNDPEIFYLAGRSMMELGRFRSAARRFERVITFLRSNHSQLTAESYFFAALCYEAMSEDDKTIAALLDAKIRRDHLPEDLKHSVLFARLAWGYARIGNFVESQKYQKFAEVEFLKRKKDMMQLGDRYSRILYWMGGLGPLSYTNSNFENSIQAFKGAQRYLYQLVELNAQEVSAKASEEMISNYQKIWAALDTVELQDNDGDRLLSITNQQKRKKEMAEVILELIRSLDAQVIPVPQNAELSRVNLAVQDVKAKANMLILDRPLNEGLTSESLLREGRVIDPTGKLEKKPRLPEVLPEKKTGKNNSKNGMGAQEVTPLPKPTAPIESYKENK